MQKHNLLIPLVGHAKRFADAGYTLPKPLIVAHNRQIIDWAFDSIDLECFNPIFIIRRDHINNFSLDEILIQKFGEHIKIVISDGDTAGSVITCLLAKEYIDNEIPVAIYTPDVYFQDKFKTSDIPSQCDGFLLTFKANSPAHSYVKLDDNNIAIQVAEKQVISSNAAVGLYWFRSGKLFLQESQKLLQANDKINNEFYLCPIYNYLIKDGLIIKTLQVKKLHVLGTPEELNFFTNNVCRKFGDKPIALCCDHSGYQIKEIVKNLLTKHKIQFIDFGAWVSKDSDYNDFVIQASKAIQLGTCDFAMGFCCTGQGVNIAANKNKNIRAALVLDSYMAEMSRKHNCANFFSIAAKYVDEQKLESIILTLRESSFDGGRHMTRMQKTMNIENSK